MVIWDEQASVTLSLSGTIYLLNQLLCVLLVVEYIELEISIGNNL